MSKRRSSWGEILFAAGMLAGSIRESVATGAQVRVAQVRTKLITPSLVKMAATARLRLVQGVVTAVATPFRLGFKALEFALRDVPAPKYDRRDVVVEP